MNNNDPITASFTAWLATRQHHGLPWQTDSNELREAYAAGYNAAPNAAIAQSVESRDIHAGDAGSSPAGSSSDSPGISWAGQVALEKAGLISYDTGLVVMFDSLEVTAEDIYKAYPRKIGKQAALKAIKKAIKVCEPKDSWVGAIDTKERYLLKRTQAYAAATEKWKPEDKQYIPHPATWFNRGSYDDDPKEWERGTAIASQFRQSH